jgi:hypothetical protein
MVNSKMDDGSVMHNTIINTDFIKFIVGLKV